MDYAKAVNAEIRDLFAAGADVVQIDEPYMQARPDEARAFGLKALNQALDGVTGTTAVHICFGYAAIIHSRPSAYSFLPELAALRLQAGFDGDRAIEARLQRARAAGRQEDHARRDRSRRHGGRDAGRRWPRACGARCAYVPAENIILAPDCGMKYLPREIRFGKLKAMVAGAAIVRTELSRAA